MRAEWKKLALVAALAVAAVAIYLSRVPDPAGSAQTATQQSQPAAHVPSRGSGPDVHLNALESARPGPNAGDRSVFQFRQRATLPTNAAAARSAAPPEAPPTVARPPAPTLPAIALKFIGLIEAPERAAKIAVLSDGRNVFHGSEGDIIEGRYRIVRIGAESLEMAYLDGRGRQTIRLTGS